MNANFPPVFSAAETEADPHATLVDAAQQRPEPARLFWSERAGVLSLAIELAPEMTLSGALLGHFALALGTADAIGVLAPPEVGVFFRWPASLRVNGADCGTLRASADTDDPDTEPGYLVVSMALRLTGGAADPGRDAAHTSLAEEGAFIDGRTLAAAVARHTQSWLYRLTDEGPEPLIAALSAKIEPADLADGHTLDRNGNLTLIKDGKTVSLSLRQALLAHAEPGG